MKPAWELRPVCPLPFIGTENATLTKLYHRLRKK